jgi:DNA processing protein
MNTTLDTLRGQAGESSRNLDGDTLARAAWTVIAEPQDDDAGRLIAAVGAEEALHLILSTEEKMWEEIPLEKLRARVATRSTGTLRPILDGSLRLGIELVTPSHPHWPHRLDDLGTGAPYALWVRGNTSMLGAVEQIAVVGARAATGYGEHVTMEITAGLVDRGHQIVSGAAYGIDGMAHRATLAAQGDTVAYLAGGVDRYYPSGHEALLTRIAQSGAVVSEMPLFSAPTKWRFLARNRLIAASAKATVVVEAGFRSGSLNTAGYAIALGRPVGAVPGPVTSATSAGCHRLIRDCGATLVTTAEEVVDL